MKVEKGKKKILSIIILVLIGIMLFFTRKDNQDKFVGFVQNIGISNREFKEVSTITTEEDVEDFTFYDKGIIVCGNKKLIKFKMDGSKEWERIFNVDDLGITFGESSIYVYDKATGDIYFLNSKGETIKRVHLKTKINNMVENFGNIIAHIEKSDMEGIIMLDQEGEIVEEKMVERGNILTYSLAKDDQIYAISLLDLGGDELNSQVKIFKLDGELLFDIPITDEIIVHSQFIDEGKLLVTSDKGLYCIYDGEILWDKKFKSINHIYIDEEKINILHGDRLEFMSFDGNRLNSRSLAERYNKVNPYNKGLILYGNEYIMGLKNNKEIFKYRGEGDILKVDHGRDKLIINYKDRIDIISK